MKGVGWVPGQILSTTETQRSRSTVFSLGNHSGPHLPPSMEWVSKLPHHPDQYTSPDITSDSVISGHRSQSRAGSTLSSRDNFLKGLISCIPSSCSWPLIVSLYINFNNTSNTNVLGASQNKHLRQLHD